MPTFSDRLKQLRKTKNLTQKNMAEFLGCTERHYQKIEYGQVTPNAPMIIKLANHFGVSTDYLLGCSDNPTKY